MRQEASGIGSGAPVALHYIEIYGARGGGMRGSSASSMDCESCCQSHRDESLPFLVVVIWDGRGGGRYAGPASRPGELVECYGV
jgi:hypothetical protein